MNRNGVFFTLIMVMNITFISAFTIKCDHAFECKGLTIDCLDADDCHVECLDYESCAMSIINGPSISGDLFVKCSGEWSCDSIVINGSLSQTLYIDASGAYSLIPYYFQEGKIVCPKENQCIINVHDGSQIINNNTQIYAVKSFNNINFTVTNCSDCIYPTMFCTDDFTENCQMNLVNGTRNEWECFNTSAVCNDYPPSPTLSPTIPTSQPTNAPSTSPLTYDPPYSSDTVLYVRQNGCDEGDCSSNVMDSYDLYCNNSDFRVNHDECCSRYPNATANITIPTDCEGSYIVINESKIYNGKLIGTRDYPWVAFTKHLCFRVDSNYVCYSPHVTVNFQWIDYIPLTDSNSDTAFLTISYQDISNVLNPNACRPPRQTHIIYSNCSQFVDCAVNNPDDNPWFSGFKILYAINGNQVGHRNNCSGNTMNVDISVDCTETKLSTCNTVNYAFSCFNGEESVNCSTYDGNGIIDIGAGTFYLNTNITSKHQQIILQGVGVNTVLMHIVEEVVLIHCEWIQCHIMLRNMKYSTSNNDTKIEILNGGQMLFENVLFENGETSLFMFSMDGIRTNVTFIDCEFRNNKIYKNTFIINNGAIVLFKNCKFTNNFVYHHLFVLNNGILTFEDSYFKLNIGNMDKNIIVHNGGSLQITNCLFYKNQEFNSIVNANNTNVILTSSLFIGNWNINHLVQIRNSNSSIFTNEITDDNQFKKHRFQFLNTDLMIDEYSLSTMLSHTTPLPSVSPTVSQPTPSPTDAPTPSPTPAPSTAITITPCGNYCYDAVVQPAINQYTAFPVEIQSNRSQEIEINFTINFIVEINPCIAPAISFEWNEMMASESNYLYLFDKYGTIAFCEGTGDIDGEGICTVVTECLYKEALLVNQIEANTSYSFTVYQPIKSSECIGWRDHLTEAKLTLSCFATPHPTTAPTTTCETDIDKCYDMHIYSDLAINTEFVVNITSYEEKNTDMYFQINFISDDIPCSQPKLSFEFAETDYDTPDTEYLDVFSHNDILMAHCIGSYDLNCYHWTECINNMDLGISTIGPYSTYTITVYKSQYVDNLYHYEYFSNYSHYYEFDPMCLYSINAKLKLLCQSIDSLHPTTNPTRIPSIPPTTIPTLFPTVVNSSKVMQYGHTIEDERDITLQLSQFNPMRLLGSVDFIHFGKDNGSIIYDPPCTHFNSSNITDHDILFNELSYGLNSSAIVYDGTHVQELMICTDNVICYMKCNSICTESTFNSNVSDITLIECTATMSCSYTTMNISSSTTAAVLCQAHDSCKGAQINVIGVDIFYIECIALGSCQDAVVNIRNVSGIEIRCYLQNSCKNINILSDNDETNFTFYNFNENVNIDIPKGVNITEHLNCDPLNAYLLLDGSVPINESLNEIFDGGLPCSDVWYTFTAINRVQCQIRYSAIPLTLLQYLYDFISCFIGIFISELYTYDCIGTWAPTNAPSLAPSNAPSITPSLSPTHHPSHSPTLSPSSAPSKTPTDTPSAAPTNVPSNAPTLNPTDAPSLAPSHVPTNAPSKAPTTAPSRAPSLSPTASPTNKECGFITFDVPYNVIQYLVLNYSLSILDWNCLLKTGNQYYQFTVNSTTLGINDIISIPSPTANNDCLNCVVNEDQYILTQIKTNVSTHQLSIHSIESVNGVNLFVESDKINVEICDVSVSFSLISRQVVNEQNLIIKHEVEVANCHQRSLLQYYYIFNFTSFNINDLISITNNSGYDGITVPQEAVTGDYVLYIKQNEETYAENMKIETDFINFTICDVEFSFLLSPQTFDPGQYLDVNVNLHSIHCNITKIQNNIPHSYQFSIFSSELQINHIIEYDATTKHCKICSINNQCFDSCSNVLLPNVDKTNQTQTDHFEIFIKSQSDTNGPNIEISTSIVQISASVCDVGEGADQNTFLTDCNPCLMDEIKFTTGTRSCYKCNSVDLQGVHSCLGSYRMIIPYNHWSTAFNEATDNVHALYDIKDDDIIFTAACPEGFCCSNVDGCEYLIYVSDNYMINPHLCTQNRHPETALCSQCNDGMYELFGSSACGICSKWNYFMLILMGFAALLFVLWVVFIDSTPPQTSQLTVKEYKWKKAILFDEFNQLKTLCLKIITYFYQSLLQIITSQQIVHNLLPILGPFSISFASSSNSAMDGMCIIPRLNSLQEIVTNYFFILLMFGNLLFVGIIVLLQRKCNTKCCCKKCNNPKLCSSFIRIFLIVSGSLMSTSWKLLSCVNLAIYQTKYVHFYQTSDECFDNYWFIALSILCLTIAAYGFMLWRICNKYDEYTRSDVNNEYRGMLKSFKPNCYWFEFVLFSRRLLIASLTQIVLFVNVPAITTVLIGFIAIFLSIHIRKFPFLYFGLNIVEAICLLLLIVVISAHQLNYQSSADDPFITICIILPLIIFVGYVIKLFILVLYLRKKTEPNQYLQSIIDSVQMRIPKRYQPQLRADKTEGHKTETVYSPVQTQENKKAPKQLSAVINELYDTDRDDSDLYAKHSRSSGIELQTTKYQEKPDKQLSVSTVTEQSKGKKYLNDPTTNKSMSLIENDSLLVPVLKQTESD